MSHERRILLMAVAAGLPGSVVSLALLWMGDYTPRVQWTLTVLIVALWSGFAFAVRRRVVFPLQTVSNLLAALREGDYSIRARGAKIDDALGEVMLEVNILGKTLREQRLGALEATTLLRTVMANWGLKHTLVNMQDLAAVERAITPATRLIWTETPSNPLLNVTDLRAIVALAGLRLASHGHKRPPEVYRLDPTSVMMQRHLSA